MTTDRIPGAPAIVGICGPKGTGKDTTATRLLSWFRPRTKQANITWFADPLYQMVEILTGVPVEYLRDQRFKEVIWTAETAPIPTLAKDLGMWVRDEVHAEHWAAHLKQRTSRGVQGWKSWWFVPDTRFVNETNMCDVVIEVRRSGIEYDEDHPSEKRLPEHLIDHTVWLTPDMDYAKLARTILTLVGEMRGAVVPK